MRQQLFLAPENWKYSVVSKPITLTFLFLNLSQGEDGFPGFKGDMGIKGDRVRTAALRPP